MSHVMVFPGCLRGRIRMPASKSAAHRAILCAALAKGESVLENVSFSNDIRVTLDAVKAMGAEVDVRKNGILIRPGELKQRVEIDCGESGSTLRFLIPICAALGIEARFTGHGRLPERPLGEYLDLLPKHGVQCESSGGLPLTIRGKLEPGRFLLPGNVSSQYITGLLMALPLLDGESEIVLTSPLESAGYVDMTLREMARFDILVHCLADRWQVKGPQEYQPRHISVEGDWSQAAFFLSAGALGGQIQLDGLDISSAQGDKACASLFRDFGAEVGYQGGVLTVGTQTLRGMEIDASQVPDLVPALAATAALARGTTRIYNADRLRIKESDRLAAMANAINALGGYAEERPDGLVITGVSRLHKGKVEGCNDHRIVMAMSVAALCTDGPVTVTDSQSVNKSYPDFFRDFEKLGGRAHVLNLG